MADDDPDIIVDGGDFEVLPPDPRMVVDGSNPDGSFRFRQVDVADLSTRARFGAVALSTSQWAMAIGQTYFTLDVDEGTHRIGDDVQITSLEDPACFAWGDVIGKDTTVSPARLLVYVDDLSPVTMTGQNWELQVTARPKQGITKDVSTTSMDPTAAGPFTMTVTAGKFFPLGGKLLLIPLAARDVAFVGLVLAYSGTTLTVEKNSTNAVTGPYTSWAIALLDAPQDKTALYQISGLRISVNALDPLNDIDVTAGSVRDSTDTVNLVLNSGVTKKLDAAFAAGTNQGAYVESATLTGTVSTPAPNSLTGVGTAFLTTIGLVPFLTDYDNQYRQWRNTTDANLTCGLHVVGTFGGTIASTNTAGFCDLSLAGTNATYKRSSFFSLSAATTVTNIAVLIVRKDSDGSVDICTSTFNGSGVPDLPAGYTYYRVIGAIFGSLDITQPLHGGRAKEINYDDSVSGIGVVTVQEGIQVLADLATGFEDRISTIEGSPSVLLRAIYSATITPTAVTGSVSSVNSTTDIITWSTNHGLTTGQMVRGIGTVPTGFTAGRYFYVNALSPTTFALYTTLARAVGNTSKQDLTTTTTGATMVKLVASNEFSSGMQTVSAVVPTVNAATIGLLANIGGTLNPTLVLAEMAARNLQNTAPATVANWLQPIPTSFASSTITFSDLAGMAATSGPGLWTDQGTTPFLVSFKMWSDA